METKSAFKSLTIWGVILSAICSFIHNRTGVNVADQVPVVQHATAGIVDGFQQMAPSLGELAGAIMVIVGRFRATQPLHVLPKSTSPSSPTSNLLIGSLAVLLIALGLSACGSTSGGSSSTAAGGVSSTATVSSAPAPSAMKAWVDNNWLIFYDAGQYGSQAYVAFGVQHGSTKVQLAQDVLIIDQGLHLAATGGAVSSAQIVTDVQNAGANAGTKTANYAQVGSVLSPFIAPVIALLGGDAQATVEALTLIADGGAYTANGILGNAQAAPTSNPYATPASN